MLSTFSKKSQDYVYGKGSTMGLCRNEYFLRLEIRQIRINIFMYYTWTCMYIRYINKIISNEETILGYWRNGIEINWCSHQWYNQDSTLDVCCSVVDYHCFIFPTNITSNLLGVQKLSISVSAITHLPGLLLATGCSFSILNWNSCRGVPLYQINIFS